jgi:hypothetical protein
MPLIAANELYSPDNALDIGASGANRPRTIYAGTSFVGPGAVPTGGTAGQVLAKVDATNYNTVWQTPAAGLTIPLSQNLTWTPDNTYDIGASGATRPRDLFLGRNLSVAGTSQLSGVVGINIAPNPSYTLYVQGNMVVANTVGFGILPATNTGFNVNYNLTGGVAQVGMSLRINGDSQATSEIRGWSCQLGTTNATFNVGTISGIFVDGPILGTGATATTIRGVNVNNQGKAGITNAYGVYIANQTGSTNNWGLFNAGITAFDNQVYFNTDNTYDIGGNNAARPRYVVVGTELWVGANFDTSMAFGVFPNGTMTGTFQYGARIFPKFSTAATGWIAVIEGGVELLAGSANTPNVVNWSVAAPVIGAGRTAGNVIGLYINNQGGAGIASAYGIQILNQSGASTNNIALDCQGRAKFAQGGLVKYLGAVAFTPAFTTTTTGSWVLVTGTGNTFVATVRGVSGDVLVCDVSVSANHSVNNAQFYVSVMIDGSPQGINAYTTTTAAGNNAHNGVSVAISGIAAGSHTFGIGVYLTTAGTLTINQNIGVRVLEVQA